MGWTWAIAKASRSPGVLLLFTVAIGGCLAPRADPTETASAAGAFTAPPSASPAITDRQLSGDEPVVADAVRSEEPVLDAGPNPQRGNGIVPGELPTYSLNPVLDLLKGNSLSQTNQEAFETLGLLGLTGMARMMRGIGTSSGSRHRLNHVAELTDDLLQPDEEAYRGKRPPCVFGLEWKY